MIAIRRWIRRIYDRPTCKGGSVYPPTLSLIDECPYTHREIIIPNGVVIPREMAQKYHIVVTVHTVEGEQ